MSLAEQFLGTRSADNVTLAYMQSFISMVSPQATVCCYVGAAAVVHFRPGRPGLLDRGFNPSHETQLPGYMTIDTVAISQKFTIN